MNIFSLFNLWLSIIFRAPFMNLEMLWTIIPIWITFVFTDFYTEKKGTKIGNAISNGAIMLWAGIDWSRYLIRTTDNFSWTLFGKYALCGFMILFGLLIVVKGIKGKKFVLKLARIRETSYIMIVFAPIIYGIFQFTWWYVLAIIIFSPIFYYFFEGLSRIIPEPQ